MILSIALLFGFQLGGVAVAAFFGLPIPGTVLGLVLFLVSLFIFDRLYEKSLPVVNVLLANFGLMFVPASVGIMQYTDLLEKEWLPIVLSIVISSLLAMATTVLVVRYTARFLEKRAGSRSAK